MSTHYKGTPIEQDVLNCWIKFNRAYVSVGHVLKTNMDTHGFTGTQFGVMEILEHIGPMPLKVIGEKILLSPSNLVLVVDNLERDGYVVREKNPKDRRSIIVSLTELGHRIIKPVFKSHLSEMVQAFDCLSNEEIETLADVCKKLGLHQSTKK
ncbi:MAG: MarR family transcriptional regulator [Candidatus Marinimicrobia bacterium]|jgi:MarR family 2-MHQ and catechol resistance regulon transcriptional repressor|nr:MarR family transcriptional regulator [Candidatus Neomarinimicrobiota bacterium]MBT3574723.1 MarR family transcriptional regulator [Candidatus Neomarinimicrobiota bacterium]MBT3680558.1 MarR family transcriptional regulator [Candidatus Neomarinimicrobiota bacterium]MBT3952004.1 MarR family transcriptional regulator [Candidatus Neomarinimicrobiota bacterium]MBT4252573.1 MarR family transcriptional regulator [Candidatus Neomarinimicrobiota bacterium]